MNQAPDPALLRKAVRLVHCLQKERGASCAYSVSPGLFEDNMIHSRHQTDTAVRLWGSIDKRELSILDSLQTVRTHVTRDVDYYVENTKIDMDRSVGEYHRILVLFNSMISSVLHSFLLPNGKRAVTMSGSKRGVKSHRRHYSDGPLGMSEPIRSQELDHHRIKGSRGVKFARESRTPALLNLLECFVALKESTGLERALLSSMFAMGTVDHRLLNDLVLEVENQFKLINVLQNLHDLDGNVLLLIRENVGLPPSMERLQSFILSEFDLEGFQQEMNHESVWNLITVYMDKLHSLELLIIEELESSLSEDNKDSPASNLTDQANDDTAALLHQALGTNGNLQKLEDMPADRVKAVVLAMMTASSCNPISKGDGLIPSESTPSQPRAANSMQLLAGDDGVDEKPVPSEWDINLYEIHFQKRIGRGTAGTTYLAKWSGQEVAVKVAAVTEMGLDGWKTEVKSLRKLHHPNIIRLLGSVYNESPLTYCLVLEYCNGGDLQEAMKKSTHPKFFFKVASDIAHGMAYLHHRGIVHRDIKPANVLIDGDVACSSVSAKVTDFGVAAIEHKQEMTSETGTYRWMAPEVIRHHPYSEKADCYSYGVLLWQMITREVPFPNHSPLEAAGKVALEMARPDFPNATPPGVKAFIEGCWAEDPEWRYSFEEITKKLAGGLELSPTELKWVQAPFGHPVYSEEKEEEEEDEEARPPVLLEVPLMCRAADKHPKGFKKLFGNRKSLARKASRDE
ncbi:protein tyrosine kinase [Fragilaria crotonensis]|nr:protein tyrosine kinase [Fragilaria crotonensis]